MLWYYISFFLSLALAIISLIGLVVNFFVYKNEDLEGAASSSSWCILWAVLFVFAIILLISMNMIKNASMHDEEIGQKSAVTVTYVLDNKGE